MNAMNVIEVSVLFAVVLFCIYITPKIVIQIKRAGVEARRIKRMEVQDIASQPLNMHSILETVGGLDRKTALKVIKSHMKYLSEKVIAYLPATNQRVRREDVEELGRIRLAYEMLGVNLRFGNSGIQNSSVVGNSLSSPTKDEIQEWRNYIRETLAKSSKPDTKDTLIELHSKLVDWSKTLPIGDVEAYKTALKAVTAQ